MVIGRFRKFFREINQLTNPHAGLRLPGTKLPVQIRTHNFPGLAPIVTDKEIQVHGLAHPRLGLGLAARAVVVEAEVLQHPLARLDVARHEALVDLDRRDAPRAVLDAQAV